MRPSGFGPATTGADGLSADYGLEGKQFAV